MYFWELSVGSLTISCLLSQFQPVLSWIHEAYKLKQLSIGVRGGPPNHHYTPQIWQQPLLLAVIPSHTFNIFS